jgi:hypothetical protein
VKLIYKAPQPDHPEEQPTVSMNLKNTSIYEALSMIGMLNALEVKIHGEGAFLTEGDAMSLSSW